MDKLDRIAFVARNYPSLRGKLTALFFLPICLGGVLGVVYPLYGGWERPNLHTMLLLCLVVGSVLCYGNFVRLYFDYRKRYGRVQYPPSRTILGFAGAIAAYQVILWLSSPVVPWLDINSALLFVMSIYLLGRMTGRGGSSRWYVAGAAVILVVGTLFLVFSPRLGYPNDKAVTMALVGGVFVVVGLLDHRLLRKALGSGQEVKA